MYIPSNIKIDDISIAHNFINEFGFGVIVTSSLTGTHIPFVLHNEEGEKGVLYSHCARANKHWQELHGSDVLIIFMGPHSYISPSWYAQSPGVPTWNYSAVHAYGKVSLLNDTQTLEVVEEVVNKYEPDLLVKRDIITDEFRDKLLSGIVGFKIEISDIECKLKLGQQRKAEDQSGVYNALLNSSDFDAQSLAQHMKKLSVGTGS
ncbi:MULTISPECIES: FMN-binding negative transcriptional regulator [unclassified Colwellia]|uniref:FMN-binding negative transcriptional regulator n=1 Tax=unclassified Colwellia TaxID=196834 RepID=UPI0015F6C862|nr:MULTISPECIES: FMN-binding negative transcriptional regulator [unclassified Colwellia]MBA6231992.1 FMN-binding negative transcriptional regulator [Colwellia sp. MB02u-7]MBA6235651.1 FMN-binding negative transcriptional regulator [Colwellia sp. MB02u-11]MBA6297889.1 FMN-binding negative transcriptional regulator [Colwellia sp. MB3u-22]MBA6309435.1 FMN-binding negative transcriptional regulator [Colwellia sp. MB3u-64]